MTAAIKRRGPGPRQRWFLELLGALLEGDEDTLALTETAPFSGEPPERIRVLRYRYRFVSPTERAETGQWWTRDRVGTYIAPVTLADLRVRLIGPGNATRRPDPR